MAECGRGIYLTGCMCKGNKLASDHECERDGALPCLGDPG